MNLPEDNIHKLIVVGDRVLIKPKTLTDRTKSGLYLPPTVIEKEEIQSGYIIKVGPGYPIPNNADDDDTWKKEKDKVRYIPLQAKEGDLALYLQRQAIEIEFEQEKYFLVPQSAILLLLRDEGLFE
ncbi:MAG TPA: co-chaperone GroES family protein [Bacteroidales bacterium]|nr:co-chaperone GroES family protein [Bacteroidales bacterium]HPS15885.1 co-chaperone GroES family protein [Bacteroidales bacterium]